MNKLTGLSGLALAAALFGGIALASHAPLPSGAPDAQSVATASQITPLKR